LEEVESCDPLRLFFLVLQVIDLRVILGEEDEVHENWFEARFV